MNELQRTEIRGKPGFQFKVEDKLPRLMTTRTENVTDFHKVPDAGMVSLHVTFPDKLK